MQILNLVFGALGSILKWLIPMLIEMREKSHEAVEVDSDPAKYDAVRKYDRL